MIFARFSQPRSCAGRCCAPTGSPSAWSAAVRRPGTCSRWRRVRRWALTTTGLLLALDAPLDVYLVDQPPSVAGDIASLIDRQERTAHAQLAGVLSEMADYLTELGQQGSSRAKQVIWAVAAGTEVSGRGVGGLDIARLVGRRASGKAAGPTKARAAAVAQAVDKARRLADSLGQLGGAPAPRLMEAEEIAQLLYQRADPVCAQRYPLAGTLLDRVRRVVISVDRP